MPLNVTTSKIIPVKWRMSKIAINSMQIHLIYNQNHNSLYWLNPLHRYINDRVIDVLLTERKPINPVSLKPVASKFIDRRWVNEKRNCATSIHLNKIFKSHHEWNKFVCKLTIKSNQKNTAHQMSISLQSTTKSLGQMKCECIRTETV